MAALSAVGAVTTVIWLGFSDRKRRMINQAQLRSDTGCRPAFHPADPNIIYASSGGRLKVSRDRGRTFAAIGNLKEALNGDIAICPSIPDLMLAGTRSGKCWVSRDAGRTACPDPARGGVRPARPAGFRRIRDWRLRTRQISRP